MNRKWKVLPVGPDLANYKSNVKQELGSSLENRRASFTCRGPEFGPRDYIVPQAWLDAAPELGMYRASLGVAPQTE